MCVRVGCGGAEGEGERMGSRLRPERGEDQDSGLRTGSDPRTGAETKGQTLN